MPQFYQLSMSKNIKFNHSGFVVKATYNSSGFSSMLLPDSLFDVVARFLESVRGWKERKNENLLFCMEDVFSTLILILSRCLGPITSLTITLSKVFHRVNRIHRV
jgi:hypothetical protein